MMLIIISHLVFCQRERCEFSDALQTHDSWSKIIFRDNL